MIDDSLNKKVLIIQTAFPGDVLLAIPIAQRILETYPTAEITWVVRKGNESLLIASKAAHQIITWDKKKQKYQNLFSIGVQLTKQQYWLAINCQRFFTTGILMAFLKAQHKLGFKENPWSWCYEKSYSHSKGKKGDQNYLHEVDRNLQLLTGFTPIHRKSPQLTPGLQAIKKAESLMKQGKAWMLLAPASVWFTKQWPIEHWTKLASLIPENYSIGIIGGASDIPLGELIKSEVPRVTNFCGVADFEESAAMLQRAELLVCNDSAPLHLASSVNLPVIAIFCSTIPEFGFFPLSQRSIVMQETSNLPCRPCGVHGKQTCPLGHFACGYSVTPEKVMEAIITIST
jgi:heptosyltransferase-2